MKKRILSILLCLVMVMGLLPMQAVAEEGQECANCSHIHWGDAVCGSCGLCSADCPSGGDCWYETHCKNCGSCYMSADNWCDECGWCDDCMQEAHCLDCGRCFVGESKDELCEDCQVCSDCAGEGGVCEVCSKCKACADDGEHCQSCPNHLDDDDVCGYCDDCAAIEGLHCESCGECFENGADRCPIHEDEPHCAECAGFVCEDCGACFCETDKCDTCSRCTDCCLTKGDCTDCDCGKAGSHTHHKFNAKDWHVDETYHWHECRVCGDPVDKAPHNRTAAGRCEICGYDPENPVFFAVQPRSITKKVSYDDAEETDPNSPYVNRGKFSATAVNLAGEELSFQWYEVLTNKKTGVEYAPWKLVDGEHYAKGAATNKLDIGVPVDGCAYKYEYYCVATTVVNGKTVTAVSARAELRTVHNYSAELECLDTPRLVAIEYRDQYENPSGKKYYRQGSEYHNHECLGTQCYRTKLPAGTKHTFAFKEYLGYGFYTERPSVYKYFYLMECAECGYVELRDSDSEQTVPYTITLDAPDGAYAAYEATDQVTTNALPGTRLYADAPYVNDKGHVFKKWEVADASVDVEVVNDDVNIGTCTFVMPAHHLTLRAVYDETKVPVKSIHIKPGSVPVVSRVITVEVGTTFTVDSELTPSTNIIDNRVLWTVLDYTYASPEIVLSADCISVPNGNVSKPMTGPVTLEAKSVGMVRLRATAYSSTLGGSHVSDFVYVKVVEKGTHIHDYTDSLVPPTCTHRGYTLHTCACGASYKTNPVDPLGHMDTDGDGKCDRVIDAATGKLCGADMGGGTFVGQAKIDKAAVTVAAPVQGLEPWNAIASDTRYTVANTQWMTGDGTALNPGDTFAPGMAYTVKVTLEASSGYAFQLKEFTNGANTVKATVFAVNDLTVTPGNGSSKDSVNLFYTFTATEGGHTHSYSDDWKFGTASHWKECSCGDQTEMADHTAGDWIIDTAATATTEGAKHKECTVCRYVMETAVIPATGSGSESGSGSGTVTPGETPRTGDAGPALYGTMALASLMGGAWVIGRKRRAK